jgi:hypothetical protein
LRRAQRHRERPGHRHPALQLQAANLEHRHPQAVNH